MLTPSFSEVQIYVLTFFWHTPQKKMYINFVSVYACTPIPMVTTIKMVRSWSHLSECLSEDNTLE